MRVLIPIGLAVSIAPLDTAVNVAFPAIVTHFGIAVPAIQWVIIAYVLTYASLILGFGRLADVVGHRLVLLVGLLWSAVALALCALAPTFEWLLAARVLQGVGAALVLAVGAALATLTHRDEDRTHALAAYTLCFAAATVAGPVVGGLLVERFGWPAVFWFRIPIALGAAGLAAAWLPGATASSADERFDLAGSAALGLGLAVTLLAVARGNHAGWLSPVTLTALATGLGSVWWFLHRQRSSAAPMLDLDWFARPRFTATNVVHVLVNIASFAVLLLVPFYIMRAGTDDIAAGGLVLAISPLGFAIASRSAGRILRALGPRRAGLLALALAGAGLAGVASWPADAHALHVGIALLVQGFGHGLFQVTAFDVVMAAVPRRHHGVAGSLGMLTRTVGIVGGASVGALVFSALGGDGSGDEAAFLAAFRGTFWVACSVVVAAAVVFVLADRRR